MEFMSFNYLNPSRLLTLAVLIMLASTLFSMTAFILTGYYRGLYYYLGESDDVIAVYDRGSRTPFTGIVPAYLTEELRGVGGVLAVSPEVIVPCSVKGKSVFLRAIIPEDFLKINHLEIISGSIIKANDLNSAIVGERLANKLGISLGDRILAFGVLTDVLVELRVKGIFRTKSPMDDEILVPLHVGQWLRGSGYSQVTLIRVKINRSLVSKSSIIESIRGKLEGEVTKSQSEAKGPSGGQIIPWSRLKFQPEKIGVEEAQKFMKNYLERYGITKESFLTLSITTFILSSSAIAFALRTFITQHRNELAVLRSIGVSKKLLKIDLLIKLLPLTVLSSLAGAFASSLILIVIQSKGYLQVLSHSVQLNSDPSVFLLTLILFSTLTSFNVLFGGLE